MNNKRICEMQAGHIQLNWSITCKWYNIVITNVLQQIAFILPYNFLSNVFEVNQK